MEDGFPNQVTSSRTEAFHSRTNLSKFRGISSLKASSNSMAFVELPVRAEQRYPCVPTPKIVTLVWYRKYPSLSASMSAYHTICHKTMHIMMLRRKFSHSLVWTLWEDVMSMRALTC